MVGVKTRGFDTVEQAYRSLGAKAGNKMIRTALRAGAKPVATKAEQNSPRKSGLLASSIKINNGKSKTGTLSVKITPSKAKLTQGGRYYYATSIEGGFFRGQRLPKVTKGFLGNHRFYSKEQYRKASVKAGRQFVEGTHFMERTYDQTKSQAADIIATELIRQVDQEWTS